MDNFLKRNCNWCFTLTFIFKILTLLSITVDKKKLINCITGIGVIHVTVNKLPQKHQLDFVDYHWMLYATTNVAL